MKDSQQKDALFRYHWVQRHFAQPEVEIYLPGGPDEQAKMITDVDVLAIRPTSDLSFDRLLGDCKTLKQVSPINRALWLSGLMRFMNARAGTVILKLDSIEQDHRLAANRVGVSLFSEGDFAVYDKAINYPTGSNASTVSAQDVRDLYVANKKYPPLEQLLQYLQRDAWQASVFRLFVRNGLGELLSASMELDPAKREHLALVADAAAVISIGLADCVGRIFHAFLHPSDKASLANMLRKLVWGGREAVRFYREVRQYLLDANGVAPEFQEELELPEWNSLLQLVRTLLDQPPAAFEVPWFLRCLAIDIFRDRPPLRFATQKDLYSLKHAMMVVGYVCKACNLPREFGQVLTKALVGVQSEIVT